MSAGSVVDAILGGNMNMAGDKFDQELKSKISDALDAKRVEVGSSIRFTQELDQPIEEPGQGE